MSRDEVLNRSGRNASEGRAVRPERRGYARQLRVFVFRNPHFRAAVWDRVAWRAHRRSGTDRPTSSVQVPDSRSHQAPTEHAQKSADRNGSLTSGEWADLPLFQRFPGLHKRYGQIGCA
jgi:hypothetical protein